MNRVTKKSIPAQGLSHYCFFFFSYKQNIFGHAMVGPAETTKMGSPASNCMYKMVF